MLKLLEDLMLVSTLPLLSIFLSVHICVCFVFNQEMTHCFSRILYINLLKVWDFANFSNVKIDGFCWNCISCLAELYSVHELLVMILFTWSQRKIKLSFGLPESCTASLLCKLVLDLQIKVSDHLGRQDSLCFQNL